MLLPLALLSALYFKTSDGNIYHTIDKIPDGMCLLNNNGTELVYEATNFNTCNEIELQPGCYRAELRGGIGLQNEYCLSIAEQDFTPTISATFSINEPTTVYVFRGGDGNPGGVNVINNRFTSAFGGGASGVDSILVVGDRVWRAPGGAGTTCVHSIYTDINITGNSDTMGIGSGGNFDNVLLNQRRIYHYRDDAHLFATGGGGGASPNGTGGTDWQIRENFIKGNDNEYVNVGTNGTDEYGGNGGDIYVCYNLSCTSMVSAKGGDGGKTIKYKECGGQTAKSYGGGGGGGTHTSVYSTANGGNGGSGSTNTSDVSFVRIYKI